MRKTRDIPPHKKTDPNHKLLDCFPKKFLKIHFGDNDFYWALSKAVPLVMDRIWIPNSPNYYADKLEFVQKAMDTGFKALLRIQYIDWNSINPVNESWFEGLTVEYIDSINWDIDNHDSIYIDCYSGEYY